ncbi:unnamed protein product, partial [Laminaria digitata]
MYACESMATCEGAQVDASGASCGATQCEPVACDLYCEYGFETGPDGCETCSCVEPPVCSPSACEIDCEFGYVVDSSGCPTCQCKQPPVCEPLACEDEPGLIACAEYGVDEYGCQTCECVRPECYDVSCDLYCEYGFATDEYGCETCSCNPPPVCEPIACPEPEPGQECVEYERDERGCSTEPPVCDAVECADSCTDGRALDENGCEICGECLPPLCEPLACDLACEQGYASDERGCAICQCAGAPPCQRAEDCHYDSVCVAENTPSCCHPEDGTCTDDQPACPSTCQERQECGDGAIPCPEGRICAI